MAYGSDPEWVAGKRAARMARIDALTPEHRAFVHEFGLTVYEAMIHSGVPKVRNMRHIIRTVLSELSPTIGSFSSQGPR